MPAHFRSPDLLLGHRGWWPLALPCRVASPARSGHMYVVGKTGKGKSKFLLSCIVQDIQAGRGCGVIDPHSDLISEVLGVLDGQGALADPNIRERLLYLDPTRSDYVIPFNVLGLSAPPYEMAQNVIEAFRRTWAESLAAAPNFENNMLYALLVLIKAKRTLVELPRLWLDDGFREQLLTQVNDPELTSFFTERFARWGRDAALRIESLLNKATALTMNPYLKLMLGQQNNHLDFRYLMDNGYVLLANLGHCDEESQKLIGNLITTGFEQAAFARHDVVPHKRRPFYLYIDEFQDFSAGSGSGKTFSRILSGARKMGLHLIIAHQNLSQLSERLKGAVIGNVWTKVIFGVSEDDAYEFARLVGLGEVNPHTVKHDPQTETQHPVYLSLPEQYYDLATTLANQAPRRAVVRDHMGQTFGIWTPKVPPTHGYPEAICQERLQVVGIPYATALAHVTPAPTPLPPADDFYE
ncbi:MAG: type IV secretion system DNA-binding domain-containing protein [Anaerolineales bacterium]|nr:type IV secretion system DNA-binding domain-containing protein [Anaerolineales bacterium]